DCTAPYSSGGPNPTPSMVSPDPSGPVRLLIGKDITTEDWFRTADSQLRTRRVELRPTSTATMASDLAAALGDDEDRPDLVLDDAASPLPVARLATGLDDLPDLPADLPSHLRPEAWAGSRIQGPAGRPARRVALPATWLVHGLWFSRSLFARHGWQPPTTWPELLALGRQGREQGLQLLCWGQDHATDYLDLVVASAAKQAGPEPLRAIDQLTVGCWSHPALQSALHQLDEALTAGLVRPGGAQRTWKQAIGAFSQDQEVLMVAADARTMALARTTEEFQLDLVPCPSLTATPTMGAAALQTSPADAFILPSGSTNPAGARQALLAAFSAEAARAHCAETQLPSTRTDALPARPSRLLERQDELLRAAGRRQVTWRALDHYGIRGDHQLLWNAFLSRRIDVATLTAEMQRITDALAEDPSLARLSNL
uniref:extracellular solute-binding protein n=1 Tax=Luteococcus sp. TaxID=1969402 RepID=UPI003734EF79